MDDYLEIDIQTPDDNLKEILIAGLYDLGFEGFEEEKNILKAYIPQPGFEEKSFDEFIESKGIAYSITVIKSKNWNHEWESGFEPVVVDDFCAIRASFHEPVTNVAHEIIITPKMSFGTGHHATTYMMIKTMRKIDFINKHVFDFGTGTGVLAILAEQSGAKIIEAIDNDDWSIENARENFSVNNCEKVILNKSDKMPAGKEFDIILANINKNVIFSHLEEMKRHLYQKGTLLLSGLLDSDLPDMDKIAELVGLKCINKLVKHNWMCLQYVIDHKFSEGY